MAKDTLRRCIFRPYLKGKGPTFTLHMWDTHKTDWRGQTVIGYTLTMRSHLTGKAILLFEGDDFAGSPMNADDSDKTVVALMNFLTLRPGDTDADYFANYGPRQMIFCQQFAETLAFEVSARYRVAS